MAGVRFVNLPVGLCAAIERHPRINQRGVKQAQGSMARLPPAAILAKPPPPQDGVIQRVYAEPDKTIKKPNNRLERYGRQRAALRGVVMFAHVSCPFAVRPSTVGFGNM